MRKALSDKEEELARCRAAHQVEAKAADERYAHVCEELREATMRHQAEMEAAVQERERAASAAAAAAAAAAASAAAERARVGLRAAAHSPWRGASQVMREAEGRAAPASPAYDSRAAAGPDPGSPLLRSPACADPNIDALLQSAVAQRTRGRTAGVLDSAGRPAAAASYELRSAVRPSLRPGPVRLRNSC
jgi:hypothetical protein